MGKKFTPNWLFQFATPSTIFLLILYATLVTATPIYMLISLERAINSKERFCTQGTILRLREDAPHITAQTNTGNTRLTLPSSALSIKKRVFKKKYALQEGGQIYFCQLKYHPFGQRYITLLQSGSETLISETSSAKEIRTETNIADLFILNIASYIGLIFYAIKFRREK
jgi:hypothetical protein